MQNSRDSHRTPVESGATAVADQGRLRTRGVGKIAVMVVLIAALGSLLLSAVAIPAKAVDLDELTVVTISRDGAWGVATAGSQGAAIAAAIRACRAMAGGPSDCGAQFITTRGAWIIAGLCGTHKIMVAAETRQDAEQAALAREVVLERNYGSGWSPCRRMLRVNPDGVVIPSQERSHPVDARHGER